MPLEIPRKRYASLFGPTVKDKIRLADTDLIIEIENDLLRYGDEVVFGGGKSARDGCGQASGVPSKEALDLNYQRNSYGSNFGYYQSRHRH